AAAMSPVVERELVLDRSATRERSLVSASERRLGRLAFDLHDGALQHIAAFGADLFLVRRQLTELLPAENEALGVARINDLEARIWELDRVLRELAHSLEPGSLIRRPLPLVISDEVAAFTERTGPAARGPLRRSQPTRRAGDGLVEPATLATDGRRAGRR